MSNAGELLNRTYDIISDLSKKVDPESKKFESFLSKHLAKYCKRWIIMR